MSKCKNCGQGEGLHHYKTMSCPIVGVENPVGETVYGGSVYESDRVEERISELEKQVIYLLEHLREDLR